MTTAESIIDGCANPLNEHQRKMLKDLSDTKPSNTYQNVNPKLQDYLDTLQNMYPEKFQSPKTLKNRVFFDEPASLSTPHARFVRQRKESPYVSNRN